MQVREQQRLAAEKKHASQHGFAQVAVEQSLHAMQQQWFMLELAGRQAEEEQLQQAALERGTLLPLPCAPPELEPVVRRLRQLEQEQHEEQLQRVLGAGAGPSGTRQGGPEPGGAASWLSAGGSTRDAVYLSAAASQEGSLAPQRVAVHGSHAQLLRGLRDRAEEAAGRLLEAKEAAQRSGATPISRLLEEEVRHSGGSIGPSPSPNPNPNPSPDPNPNPNPDPDPSPDPNPN